MVSGGVVWSLTGVVWSLLGVVRSLWGCCMVSVGCCMVYGGDVWSLGELYDLWCNAKGAGGSFLLNNVRTLFLNVFLCY